MDLKEKLEQPPIADLPRIKNDLDRLGVSAVIAVRGVGNVAARVANPRADHARVASEQILHSPKAATREHRTFGRIGHTEVISNCGKYRSALLQ